jgi:transcriptional regulator with XRE-family HTH domain
MPNVKKNSLGGMIKASRERAGMTQLQLAEAIGTSKSHIYQWESDRIKPSAKYRDRIEKAVGSRIVETKESEIYSSNENRFVHSRLLLGMSQIDLSRSLDIDIDTLRAFETGEKVPSDDELKAYRKAGINDEWLSTGQGSMLIAPAQADRRSLADRLKIALKHRNKTQAELAAGIGATDSQVSLWISGEHEPRGKNRHAIATFLNINEAWLRTGSGPMDPADDYGAPGFEAETEVDRRMAQRSSQKDDVNRISQTIDAIASLLSVSSPRLKDNPVLVWQATELLKSLNAALRDLINEKGGGQSPDRDR